MRNSKNPISPEATKILLKILKESINNFTIYISNILKFKSNLQLNKYVLIKKYKNNLVIYMN